MAAFYSLDFTNESILLYNISSLDNATCVQQPGNGSNTSLSCFLELDDGSTGARITVLEIVVIVFLFGFILAIIVGNIMVILAVVLFREMRTLTNALIVSLATADLLVAIVVQPISLQHEVMGEWTLGPILCDFWITSDVFCCSASILNIVVIAIDRYWLITKNVHYTHNTTFSRRRVCALLLFFAWTLSALISSLPLFGWKAGNEREDPSVCIISQALGYTILSTFGSFWFPLVVILIVYYKIFRVAQRRARTRAKQRAVHPSVNSTLMSEMNGKTAHHHTTIPPKASDSNSPPGSPADGTGKTNGEYKQAPIRMRTRPPRFPRISHSSHRARTRSSARTLGLIIGGFVFCWLPFFMVATVVPMCPVCDVPRVCFSVVLWLGYSNSLLNPAIYAIWDKNFRRSFKRLVVCDIRWTSIL